MKMMNDMVKYQLERAEDALRSALSVSGEESVYVIAAISKSLMEIDNVLFSERITETVDKTSSSINLAEKLDPTFSEIEKRVNAGGFKWNNKTSFVPATPNSFDGDVEIE